MPKSNKEEITRYLILPTAIAAVLLYTNHCAQKRDQRARYELAAHLRMPENNPSWAEIQDRADGMVNLEAMHMRLAKLQNRHEEQNIRRAPRGTTVRKIEWDSNTSQSNGTVIAVPMPMAVMQSGT